MLSAQLLSILLLPMTAASPSQQPGGDSSGLGVTWRVYVGTTTQGASKGIYLFNLNAETGKLTPQGLAVQTENPSFLAMHPTRPFMYAVGEASKGFVSAFHVERETGKLIPINSVSSKGEGPCHLAVAPTGRDVAVANYNSGSTALFPIKDDGSLGEANSFFQHEGKSINPQRQEGPHAHGATFDVTGRFLFVPDLGADKVFVYHHDEKSQLLSKNDPAFATLTPGFGPRHIAFHPSGRFAYVVNEMGNTVTAFGYDAGTGQLTSIQTIGTLPAGFAGESTTAEIHVHPSGRFVYASNRGHDSIASFSVAPETGRLTATGCMVTGGKTPRSFCLDPAGRYLLAANQESGDMIMFRINPESGVLEVTDQRVAVADSVCVIVLKP